MGKQFTISDSYYLNRNLNSEFAMPGYLAAKTPVSLGKTLVFKKSKRAELFPFLKQKSAEPSPVHYADGPISFFKSSWIRPSGKFLSSRKLTSTEILSKSTKTSPGPSNYNTLNSSLRHNLGKFE